MKKIIIIMLVLMTVGIMSAATIHIESDMHFDRDDIFIEKLGQYNQYYQYTSWTFDEMNREIILGPGIYHIVIDGLSGLDYDPVRIERWGIYLLQNSYITIEEYFDMAKPDPGTPITQ